MLNQMRRGASGWVAKLLLGGLALSFVAWGVADVLQGRGSGSTVLSVDDVDVSVQEYQTAYEQSLSRLSQQLQRRPSAQEAEMFGLDQSVLAQLRSGALLDAQAAKVGINVSDDGLVSLIQREPAFQDGSGRFSRNIMRATLSNARLPESAYLADLRRSAIRNQLVASVSDDATVPSTFASALGAYNGERRSVQYALLQPQAPDTVDDPSADELDDYFTEHHDTYRAPELRAFSYVLLSPSQVADPAAVTAQEIEARYEADRARYTTPERRNVQQIVFADRPSAEKAVEAMKGGQTFADAAAAAGRQVADLGLVGRSAIPNQTLADAAFAAQPNVPTNVVDGPFGPVVMNILAVEPERVRPLDEVRDEVRDRIAQDTATAKVTASYTAMTDALQSGAPLAEAAQQAGLSIQTVEPVSRDGLNASGAEVSGIPDEAQVLQAVFAAETGNEIAPISFAGGNYVFLGLGDITPSRDRKLDEVHERVLADWKQDEAGRIVIERGEALADRIRKGETFESVAEVEGLTVQTAAGLTRTSGNAVLGQAGTRTAFAGPQGSTGAAPARESGEVVLLQVTEVSPVADPGSTVSQATRTSLDEALREDLFATYVAALQTGVDISVNQAAISQARTSVR